MTRRRRALTLSAFGLSGMVAIPGCATSTTPSTPAATGGPLRVSAATATIAEILRAVGGSRVAVFELTPPGGDAHDAEPGARQLEELADSTAVFFIGGGFQPRIEQNIATLPESIGRVDVAATIARLGADGQPADPSDPDVDPHLWLSPANMMTMTEQVSQTLIALDPSRADLYRTGAAGVLTELADLDTSMRAGLAACASTTFVTEHRAFGYLANRYGLTELSLAGLSPDDEPSAQELTEIATAARAADVSVVYSESESTGELARVVADELGVAVSSLHTIESISDNQVAAGIGYVALQRDNLAALRAGLRCS